MKRFEKEFTDYDLSPYTGMTRDSFKAAARYMLEGIFSHIDDIDKPLVMPRQDTDVTYPHKGLYGKALIAQKRAEIFEGLTRSLFIASVMMEEEPDISFNGIVLRDYYKLHILRSCTEKDSPEYALSYDEMIKSLSDDDPFRPFQQTVETCALVIGLNIAKKTLWDSFSKDEKDRIAGFLKAYAHSNTVPQNWRLFNMLDMAFLHMHGYDIDERMMYDHAKSILDYRAGDGWYRDGHSFDYYSCFAFNMYAPLWNVWYGYEHMPGIAKGFEDNSNRLMDSYARMFDREGHMNMWGRSCIYRNAVTSAFEGNLMLKSPSVSPGLARRICAGAMLQFLERDDFMYEGIPTLGFYGKFMPLVQSYSCAGSVFWLGKAYLCLHFPKDHPFWTMKETNGIWDEMKDIEVRETLLKGPSLCISNHMSNGQTILRTGKVLKDKDDIHGMWNYSKLSYNTSYPWESSPIPPDDKDDKPYAESQQYVLKSLVDGHLEYGNVTFDAGYVDNVFYRRQFFGFDIKTECHWLNAVDLADFTVPCGIMRVDRFRIIKRPMEISLGAYGFPDNGTRISFMERDDAKAVILKGRDAAGHAKTLAMTVYSGFDELSYIKSRGSNPDSEYSVLVYAKGALMRQYDSSEGYLFISQLISRDDETDFTEDELFPLKKISYTDEMKMGAYGSLVIELYDGSAYRVDHSGIEGRMSL